MAHIVGMQKILHKNLSVNKSFCAAIIYIKIATTVMQFQKYQWSSKPGMGNLVANWLTSALSASNFLMVSASLSRKSLKSFTLGPEKYLHYYFVSLDIKTLLNLPHLVLTSEAILTARSSISTTVWKSDSLKFLEVRAGAPKFTYKFILIFYKKHEKIKITQSQAPRSESTLVTRTSILVDGETDPVANSFSPGTVKTQWTKIPEQEVVVGASRHKGVPLGQKSSSHGLGIEHHLFLVLLELSRLSLEAKIL